MPTFGIDTIEGYSSLQQSDDYIRSNSPKSPATDGIAYKIGLYCTKYEAQGGYVKYALYDASDNSLVGVTEEGEITGDVGWKYLSFTSPPQIYSSKSYYICHWFSPTWMYYWSKTKVGGNACHVSDTYDGDYPSTISWDSESNNSEACIHCSYSGATTTTNPIKFIRSSGKFIKISKSASRSNVKIHRPY
jgi:hypothetical protein